MAQSKLMRMAENAIAPMPSVPGSKELRNRVHERYCRYRAQAFPQALAYRQAQTMAFRRGTTVSEKRSAEVTASLLSQRPEIKQRIQYLTQNAIAMIAEKRQRLEEQLWNIHQSSIGDYLETYTIDGTTKERPKLISQLPREQQQAIETLNISASGRIYPKLYSKKDAHEQLAKMLGVERAADPLASARLSDAELVQQLSEQANALGVKIDLSYRFDSDDEPSQVDVVSSGSSETDDESKA